MSSTVIHNKRKPGSCDCFTVKAKDEEEEGTVRSVGVTVRLIRQLESMKPSKLIRS